MMSFTQTMTVKGTSKDELVELLAGWDERHADAAPGYLGARLLADREEPGRFVIEVDFSSEEEARRNDGRPETREWAQKLQQAAEGRPEYSNFEVAYTTR